MKAWRIFMLCSLLLAVTVAGCKPSVPTAPESNQEDAQEISASGEPGIIKTKKLIEQIVSPGENEQSVAYKDLLKVILPAGVVKQASELTISQVVSKLLPFNLGVEELATYEIKLGEQTTFDQLITLEFAIDPTKLYLDIPVTEQVQAAFWDEAGQHWVATPATVDPTRKVAIVQTNHLSVWSMFLWMRGYETEPTEHFLFIYDKKELEKRAGAYTSQTDFTLPGIPAYISDLMDCLEKEYKVFDQEGYPLPATPIVVHVSSYSKSEYRTITGKIRLPYDMTDINDMRQTTAHELFHAIQLKTLTTPVYSSLEWWMDATADYAADAVAWKSVQGTGLMGQDIKRDWLTHDIYTTADAHAYALSHFVNYLVRKAGVDFKALWYASISDVGRVLPSIESFVSARSGYSLGFHFTNYAADFLFDNVGPCKSCSDPFDPYNDLATRRTPWIVERGEELRDAFNVPYYGANIWAIQNQFTDKDIVIERLDDGLGMVTVYVLPENDVLGQQPIGPTYVSHSEPATLRLKRSDYLFIIMDNTVSPSPVAFSMRISLSTLPAVDTYRLYFRFGNGSCERQAASGFAWVLVSVKGDVFTPYYEIPGGGMLTDEHKISVTGSGKVEIKTGQGGIKRTYLKLTIEGIDTMTSGSMAIYGTLTLLQDPDKPTHWSTGDGSDPNGGSINVMVDVSIPPRPMDDYPGMACTATALMAEMSPK